MSPTVVLLSIPALRERDLAHMPNVGRLMGAGQQAELSASFPGVTCPVQANMTTGCLPCDHGVVANGFYWRDQQHVEMWTAGNDCIEQPQIWDRLHEMDRGFTSAVWFPLHSKGCGADYVCTPAPIHNEDGTESLWCYSRPEGLYQELLDELGHFPLHHFWGPLSSIASTSWIFASAVRAAEKFKPNFFYIYVPHLDYAPQKFGPDSDRAVEALGELDGEIGKLVDGFTAAYGDSQLTWLMASEYTIVPVDHVIYPNRLLASAGLLQTRPLEMGRQLDFEKSAAWALVDHQLAHVFVRDSDRATIQRVRDLFSGQAGIAEVLAGDESASYSLDHPRSGDLVLVSEPHSWQAYYWWDDDADAPAYARTVDIHSKPGYDPVEMYIEPTTKSTPLDASLVQGSHGAPATSAAQRGIFLASRTGVVEGSSLRDTDIAGIVLRQFGA